MKTSEIAVINKGIDGDRLTDNGIKRFAHDVLNIKGVKYIVVLYGVNDLNALNRTSTQIISAYKSLIKQAHEKNIYIYTVELFYLFQNLYVSIIGIQIKKR